MERQYLSPLMSAVVVGDLAVTEAVLAGGANPNEEGWVPNGTEYCTMPALACAVWLGHVAIAKALITQGANADASVRFGREDDDAPLRYALGLAIDRRDVELVAMLLDAGARVAYEPPPWLGEPLDALAYTMERAYDARIIGLLRQRSQSASGTSGA